MMSVASKIGRLSKSEAYRRRQIASTSRFGPFEGSYEALKIFLFVIGVSQLLKQSDRCRLVRKDNSGYGCKVRAAVWKNFQFTRCPCLRQSRSLLTRCSDSAHINGLIVSDHKTTQSRGQMYAKERNERCSRSHSRNLRKLA